MLRRIGENCAESLIAFQNRPSASRAPSGPPRSWPSANTTAFIAPALVPLIPRIDSRLSSSSRSSTPQVSAPCDPPPCSARLIGLTKLLDVFGTCCILSIRHGSLQVDEAPNSYTSAKVLYCSILNTL